ncbi:MAG: polysaccharide deacetylase family protein [Cyanobacteria bacterium P01_A01_bin.45]
MSSKYKKFFNPKNFSKYIVLIAIALLTSACVIPLSIWIAKINNVSPKDLSTKLTSFKITEPKKPITLNQFCQKYESIGRDLQLVENQSLVTEEILYQTKQDKDTQLTLAAETFPDINARAREAKVPVVMYHDILPKKEVFFDVTPEELEADFELIKSQGLTPISLDQLVAHLRTGSPLPAKPILLTFDDGYGGHYEYVYPLLEKYGYPAVFSIYIKYIGINTGRSHVSWEEIKTMSKNPLVTIAAHSMTHPPDLTKLSEEEIRKEIFESKQKLEKELGKKINYFTYPAGKHNETVKQLVQEAGYVAALSMDDNQEIFAGESPDLFAIGRFGQSSLQDVVKEASGGSALPQCGFDFTSSIRKENRTENNVPLILISGGKPETIHADSRYQVPEIIKDTGAIAAVDGGFFSLKTLTSNVMIGPVLSKRGQGFIPGNKSENPKLNRRPLVLISDRSAKFIPFDAEKHNTLEGIKSELTSVNDAFVGAAFLVKDGEPQDAESFGDLYGFDAARFRAFWGISKSGVPVVGVSNKPVDSVRLGKALADAGLRDAVMLDSGASTSLAYQGSSIVGYTPRPVPHVVALFPPSVNEVDVDTLSEEDKKEEKSN